MNQYRVIISIRNFLSDFESFRKHATSQSYAGETNPYDGVFYPDISTGIPEEIQAEIVQKLEARLGIKIKVGLMFMRLMTSHTPTPPHQAHHDKIMGRYTGLLYINEGEGGTSLLSHKEYGVDVPDEVWHRDTNRYDAWDIVDFVRIEPNKMTIIDSDHWHRAEPVQGFGDSPSDGRLVLTVFFDEL